MSITEDAIKLGVDLGKLNNERSYTYDIYKTSEALSAARSNEPTISRLIDFLPEKNADQFYIANKKQHDNLMQSLQNVYQSQDIDINDVATRIELSNLLAMEYPEYDAKFFKDNLNSFMKQATGYDIDPQTFSEHLGQTFKSSALSYLASTETFFTMLFNRDGKDELIEKLNGWAKDYRRDIGDEKYSNIFQKMLSATVQQAPNLIGTMAITAATSVIGGIAGGALGATMNIGKVLGIGSNLLYSAAMEGGDVMLELIQAGADDNTAIMAGLVVGIINGSLEAFGDNIILGSWAKIVKAKPAIGNAMAKEIRNFWKIAGKDIAKQMIKQYSTEIPTEIAQELVSMLAYNAALSYEQKYGRLEGLESKQNWAEAIAEIAKETALSTTLVAFTPAVLSNSMNYIGGTWRNQIQASDVTTATKDSVTLSSRMIKTRNDPNQILSKKDLKKDKADAIHVVRIGNEFFVNGQADDKQLSALRSSKYVNAVIDDIGLMGKDLSQAGYASSSAGISLAEAYESMKDALANNMLKGYSLLDENGEITTNETEAKSIAIEASNAGGNITIVRLGTDESLRHAFDIDVFGKSFSGNVGTKASTNGSAASYSQANTQAASSFKKRAQAVKTGTTDTQASTGTQANSTANTNTQSNQSNSNANQGNSQNTAKTSASTANASNATPNVAGSQQSQQAPDNTANNQSGKSTVNSFQPAQPTQATQSAQAAQQPQQVQDAQDASQQATEATVATQDQQQASSSEQDAKPTKQEAQAISSIKEDAVQKNVRESVPADQANEAIGIRNTIVSNSDGSEKSRENADKMTTKIVKVAEATGDTVEETAKNMATDISELSKKADNIENTPKETIKDLTTAWARSKNKESKAIIDKIRSAYKARNISKDVRNKLLDDYNEWLKTGKAKYGLEDIFQKIKSVIDSIDDVENAVDKAIEEKKPTETTTSKQAIEKAEEADNSNAVLIKESFDLAKKKNTISDSINSSVDRLINRLPEMTDDQKNEIKSLLKQNDDIQKEIEKKQKGYDHFLEKAKNLTANSYDIKEVAKRAVDIAELLAKREEIAEKLGRIEESLDLDEQRVDIDIHDNAISEVQEAVDNSSNEEEKAYHEKNLEKIEAERDSILDNLPDIDEEEANISQEEQSNASENKQDDTNSDRQDVNESTEAEEDQEKLNDREPLKQLDKEDLKKRYDKTLSSIKDAVKKKIVSIQTIDRFNEAQEYYKEKEKSPSTRKTLMYNDFAEYVQTGKADLSVLQLFKMIVQGINTSLESEKRNTSEQIQTSVQESQSEQQASTETVADKSIAIENTTENNTKQIANTDSESNDNVSQGNKAKSVADLVKEMKESKSDKEKNNIRGQRVELANQAKKAIEENAGKKISKETGEKLRKIFNIKDSKSSPFSKAFVGLRHSSSMEYFSMMIKNAKAIDQTRIFFKQALKMIDTDIDIINSADINDETIRNAAEGIADWVYGIGQVYKNLDTFSNDEISVDDRKAEAGRLSSKTAIEEFVGFNGIISKDGLKLKSDAISTAILYARDVIDRKMMKALNGKENILFQDSNQTTNNEVLSPTYVPFYEDYVYKKKDGKYAFNRDKLAEAIYSKSNGNISFRQARMAAYIMSIMPKDAVDRIIRQNGGRLLLSTTETTIDIGNANGAFLKKTAQIILSPRSNLSTILHESFHAVLWADDGIRSRIYNAVKETMLTSEGNAKLRSFLNENRSIFGQEQSTWAPNMEKALKALDILAHGSDEEIAANANSIEEAVTSIYEAWWISGKNMFELNHPTLSKLFKEVSRIFNEIYSAVTGKELLPQRIENEFESLFDGSYDSTSESINDILNTGEINEGTTAIREGFSDGRGDDFSGDGGREVSSGEGYDEPRNAQGIPEGVRDSKRNDVRSDRKHRRAILLDRILKKVNKEAGAVEFKQLDNSDRTVAEKFKNAIDNARKTQRFGLYVDSYPLDTADGYTGYTDPSIKLYMSDDESVGFAIKEDGDIVSVFSDKTKANHPMTVYSILLSALEHGGNRLDCYGPKLLKFYMQMGFVPQGKVLYNEAYESAEWTSRKDVLGSPDVYALYWNDSSIDETISKLEDRLNTITRESVEDTIANLPLYEDETSIENSIEETRYGYDRLMEARDESIDRIREERELAELNEKRDILFQEPNNGPKSLYEKLSDPETRNDALDSINKYLFALLGDEIGKIDLSKYDTTNINALAKAISDELSKSDNYKKYVSAFDNAAKFMIQDSIQRRIGDIISSPTAKAQTIAAMAKRVESNISKGQQSAMNKNTQKLIDSLVKLWYDAKAKTSKPGELYSEKIRPLFAFGKQTQGIDVASLWDNIAYNTKEDGSIDAQFTPQEAVAMAYALLDNDNMPAIGKELTDGSYSSALATMLGIAQYKPTAGAKRTGSINYTYIIPESMINTWNMLVDMFQSPKTKESKTLNQDILSLLRTLDGTGLQADWAKYVLNDDVNYSIAQAVSEEFKSRIAEKEAELETLKNDTTAKDKIDALQKDIDNLNKEISKAKNEINKKDENIKEKNKRIDDKIQRIEKLKNDKKKLNDDKNAKIKELEKEIADLTAASNTATSVKDAQKTMLERIRSTVTKFNKDVNDAGVFDKAKKLYEKLWNAGKNNLNDKLAFDFDEYSNDPIYYSIINYMIDKGIIALSYNSAGEEVWSIERSLKNITGQDLIDLASEFENLEKEGNERLSARKEQKKVALDRKIAVIKRSLIGFKKQGLSDAQIDKIISDYMLKTRPGSETYAEENKQGYINRLKTQLTETARVVKHISPALYAYMYGGEFDGEYNDNNYNSAYDKQFSNVQNRTKAFHNKLMSIFGVEEKDLKYKMRTLFSKDMIKIGHKDPASLIGGTYNSNDRSIYALGEKVKSLVRDNDRKEQKILELQKKISNENKLTEKQVMQDEIANLQSEIASTNKFLTLKETGDAEYTMQELMSIYIHAQSQKGLERLIMNMGSDGTVNGRAISNNLTIGNVLWVMEKFNSAGYSKYKAVADYIMEDVKSKFKEMYDVVYRAENRIMKEEDMYFPMDDTVYGKSEGNTLTVNGSSLFSALGMGFVDNKNTRDRVGSNHALNLSCVDQYISAITRQEHYIAFKELTDEMSTVFSNDGELATAIRAMYKEEGKGGNGQQIIEQIHEYNESIKGKSRDGYNYVLDMIGKIRSNFVVSRLCGNLSSMLQQLPTYLLVSKETGWIDATRYLLEYFANKKSNEDLVYNLSPQMQNRARLDIDTYKSLSDQQIGWLRKFVENKTGKDFEQVSNIYKMLIDHGVNFIEKLDRHVSNAMWYAIYSHNLQEYQSNSLYKNPDEAVRACATEATQKILGLVSSNNIKNNALIYASNDQAIRGMLLFTNQLSKQFNLLYGDILDFNFKSWESYKPILEDLLLLGLVSAAATAISGDPLPDEDDEDKLESFFMNIIPATFAEMAGEVPLVGSTIKEAINGTNYADANIATSFANLIKTSRSEDRKEHQLGNAIASFAEQGFDLFGLPGSAIKKGYKSIINLFDNPSIGDAAYLVNSNWGNFATSFGGR